jgi:hypothetical protein
MRSATPSALAAPGDATPPSGKRSLVTADIDGDHDPRPDPTRGARASRPPTPRRARPKLPRPRCRCRASPRSHRCDRARRARPAIQRTARARRRAPRIDDHALRSRRNPAGNKSLPYSLPGAPRCLESSLTCVASRILWRFSEAPPDRSRALGGRRFGSYTPTSTPPWRNIGRGAASCTRAATGLWVRASG